MKKYLAVLGRQPEISLAELASLFQNIKKIAPALAEFESAAPPDIRRLGGILKIAEPIDLSAFLAALPATGKLTLGLSDFSKGTNPFKAQKSALAIKKSLVRAGRSARVVPNQTAVLSLATSLHNGLFHPNKFELIKSGSSFYHVLQLSNIESYARRDRSRPARDAKVGMLPPKLAQILINLCGPLPSGSRLLDPFCGTGVLLQEAALMHYVPYGTDLNPRMIDYSTRNLEWLRRLSEQGGNARRGRAQVTTEQERADPATAGVGDACPGEPFPPCSLSVGDATTFQWTPPIDAVACETYLGPPMSQPPAEIKLRQAKQECKAIILGFLKNLAPQIATGTPVVIAVPAWLRPDGTYSRLNLLDEIEELRYNVPKELGPKDLLYHREKQVVAREIIVLRKK